MRRFLVATVLLMSGCGAGQQGGGGGGNEDNLDSVGQEAGQAQQVQDCVCDCRDEERVQFVVPSTYVSPTPEDFAEACWAYDTSFVREKIFITEQFLVEGWYLPDVRLAVEESCAKYASDFSACVECGKAVLYEVYGRAEAWPPRE